MTPLRSYAATHIGLVHGTNEDSHAVAQTAEGGVLLVVCDGMGGMGRGDEASRLAVATILDLFDRTDGLPPDRMRTVLRRADQVVRDELCKLGERMPGATAVMVYVVDGAAHVAWAGDSRAYLVREAAVLDRTRDHKLVEELIDAGQLTPEQAKSSSLAHVVTRALGGRPATEPAVQVATLGYPWKLHHADRILLCSDGVCDLVEDHEIGGVLANEPADPEAVTGRIVQMALERGGHDNITCIVAAWDGPTWVEEDMATPLIQPYRELAPMPLSPDSLPGDLDPAETTYDGGGRVTEEIDLKALEAPSQEGDQRPIQRGAHETGVKAPTGAPPGPPTTPWFVAGAVLLLLAVLVFAASLS